MRTLPVSLSEMPDSTALRWFSLITAREMSTLTSTWSEESIGAEEEQQIFSGKFVKITSSRDGLPLVEVWVGKLTN